MTDRQLDILATRADWFTLPRHLPMRLSGVDFVHFRWPCDFPVDKYDVLVEVLDNAGPTYRGISKLVKSVELPHVQYGWHPRIGVIPKDARLPAFEAEMIRGSTYIIPDGKVAQVGDKLIVPKNGRFQMERHGMHRPPGI